LDLIGDFIEIYEKSAMKAIDDEELQGQKKKSFTLYEDLVSIYSVANEIKGEQIPSSHWKGLAGGKLIHRGSESLRDRYKRYLKFLN
jgi:hypothetical protein